MKKSQFVYKYVFNIDFKTPTDLQFPPFSGTQSLEEI